MQRRLRLIERGAGPTIRREGKDLLNFASNDYLGLATDPRVVEAAAQAGARFGTGATASSLVVGYTTLHEALAERIASLVGAEAAIITPTGFAANMAAVSALVMREDLIFADALNHASLVDGCQMSGARTRYYRHRDTDRLATLLSRADRARRRFIVSDSVFSMDGTIAPVQRMIELADRHGATVVIDEAHATGVLGANGGGVCEGLMTGEPSRLVHVGTLSKALGSQGGFIAAVRETIDRVVSGARPFLYSTALAPPAAGAALASLTIVQQEPQRRKRLHEHVTHLRTGLMDQGWTVIGDAGAPLMAVLLGDPARAVDAALRLERSGICVPAIRPPTVKPGACRLRVSPMATHTTEQIAQALAAFAEIADLQPPGGMQ
ncbi:MAG: 8-amino-7-oxononanoate synthase [Phycisphaerales bacterium]|nr:8-amino-7-oxononanoate synthase [Phycisphaerales bacterium]